MFKQKTSHPVGGCPILKLGWVFKRQRSNDINFYPPLNTLPRREFNAETHGRASLLINALRLCILKNEHKKQEVDG
ncbi:hypothetical protein KSMBR1_1398 [Candidatus Kuenenia stuttgartiensis]|nr:hypothetical protein KSMBR1_1398 [Candidatus Kuenenia stuttgartiensis]